MLGVTVIAIIIITVRLATTPVKLMILINVRSSADITGKTATKLSRSGELLKFVTLRAFHLDRWWW